MTFPGFPYKWSPWM